MGKRYLKSVRLLAECMQSFERFSGEHIRGRGLTPAQFDILATLGNTPGMSYKELGEKTLITKGTLTGVIERMESRGLVTRCQNADDKRSFFVRLTPAGDALFQNLFPQVLEHDAAMFADYAEEDFVRLEEQLRRLRDAIHAALARDPQATA